jgi:hypothetical protein
LNLGTRSVLFGAHCFLIHPWLVALAWWRLYGFPWDPRLWVAFFVHDLGYWGKPNMDGVEGERHPEWGAAVMRRFDGYFRRKGLVARLCDAVWGDRSWEYGPRSWEFFVLYHSRFLSKRDGKQFSQLCVADKLVIVMEPWWLYLPRVIATGEIREYMALARVNNDGLQHGGSRRAWYRGVQKYVAAWVKEHRDGRPDTWTPPAREAVDATGVWR